MTAWRALAGAETVGQGRKPRSGGAPRDSLEGLTLVRPLRSKAVFLTSLQDMKQMALGSLMQLMS